VNLNILCLVCINLHDTWNYAEFDNNAWILPVYLSLKHTVKVTKTIISTLTHTQLVQTILNIGTHHLDNYHQSFWQLINRMVSVSWLCWVHQSISVLFSWSMSEILWRCTICCNTPTPNNLQDLGVNYLAASFLVHWTLAHRTHYTVTYLHLRVPEFIGPKNCMYVNISISNMTYANLLLLLLSFPTSLYKYLDHLMSRKLKNFKNVLEEINEYSVFLVHFVILTLFMNPLN